MCSRVDESSRLRGERTVRSSNAADSSRFAPPARQKLSLTGTLRVIRFVRAGDTPPAFAVIEVPTAQGTAFQHATPWEDGVTAVAVGGPFTCGIFLIALCGADRAFPIQYDAARTCSVAKPADPFAVQVGQGLSGKVDALSSSRTICQASHTSASITRPSKIKSIT